MRWLFYFAKTTCFGAWMNRSRITLASSDRSEVGFWLRRISRSAAFKLASASLLCCILNLSMVAQGASCVHKPAYSTKKSLKSNLAHVLEKMIAVLCLSKQELCKEAVKTVVPLYYGKHHLFNTRYFTIDTNDVMPLAIEAAWTTVEDGIDYVPRALMSSWIGHYIYRFVHEVFKHHYISLPSRCTRLYQDSITIALIVTIMAKYACRHMGAFIVDCCFGEPEDGE